MKLWHIPAFGIENLALVDAPEPVPGPGEVVIAVHAVSLNYRDLLTVIGRYNPKVRLPLIPLSDGAGVVTAIGDGVSRFKPGDRVAGIFMQNWIEGPPSGPKQKSALGGDLDGLMAQSAVLHERGVVHLPKSISFEQAATLPCAAVTAWNAVVTRARTRPGDTVVIQGTGGVSVAALQFAKAAGARVLGTSSSDEKLERARTLGLDAGLNYRQQPDWAEWVLEQTGGAGADTIIEVGGAGTLAQSLKATRVGGTVVQIGVLSQSAEPLAVGPLLHRQIHLQGIYVGSRSDFEEMNRAIETLRIEPVVDRVFPLEEAQEAFRQMQNGAHFGKLVVAMR